MNEKDLYLKVKVCDEEKFFEMFLDKTIALEDIKKRCIKKFNYLNEDINNINLWFINDNNDIKKINNDIDLIIYAKETKPSNYFIKLNVNKIKKDNIKLVEKNQKNIVVNKNNNSDENNIKKYESENIKLKKEIENVKLRINNYKEKINTLNNKLRNKKIDNDIIIINDNLNNKYENLKIEKTINSFKLNDFKVNKQLNNNKIKKNGKKYILDNLEFINNKCKICNIINLESIYKCAICDNFFLCSNCYNNNSINKKHEHNDFFEIKYPKEVITQIKEKEIIDNYYSLLKSIFFDNNGISSEKTFNVNTIQLDKICKHMKSINVDPRVSFFQYKKTYIINEIKKLEPNSKIIEIISEKEALFLNKLNDFINDKNL